MRILTNDPSIAAWGWAVIEYQSGQASILDSGCIKTESEHKKRRIRKSDDTARRLEIISQELLRVTKKYKVEWVVSEAPHGSQSASAAIMIGAVAGLMVAFCVTLGLPLEWYSEGDAKKHLLNKRSATKNETVDCIIKVYGKKWSTGIKYKDEAVADALAVFHVAEATSPALKHLSLISNKKISRTK